MIKRLREDEYLDLVDEDDNVIGKMLRSEVYDHSLSNFRVINAFVINSEGKLWIPRRSGHKGICPLCLDTSVGGHVRSGETYEKAMQREVLEELRIDINEVPYRYIGYLKPMEHGVTAFMKVYEIRIDRVPDYNKNDFVEYMWLLPEELLERIERGEKTKDDLPKLVEFFYRRH